MQIIKVKFLKADAPSGKAYTYYSPVTVAVGDKVQITEMAAGVVVAVDVSEAEVAPYKDKLKTIIGLVEAPPETYDPLAATEAQSRYCREHGVPHMAPKSGKCFKCGRNIYITTYIVKSVPELGIFDAHISPGITVERAGQEHITGCPHCGWSFFVSKEGWNVEEKNCGNCLFCVHDIKDGSPVCECTGEKVKADGYCEGWEGDEQP